MKGIVNILIVILITYTLNAIPLNNKLLSFDLIKPWDNLLTEDEKDIPPEETTALTIDWIKPEALEITNPETLGIKFISNRKLTQDQLTDLVKAMSLPKTMKNDGFTLMDEKEGAWHYAMTLDVSSQSTGYFMGTYTLSLDISSSDFQCANPQTYTLNYLPKIQYSKAIPVVDASQIYTQVYYINASQEFLVPVTKKLDSSSKFIRNTISSLSYEPPANSQIFAQDMAFPRMPRVYLSNGVLSCYLNGGEVSSFESGTPVNKLISEAIVKTLTDIGYVDNLVFYVNNRQEGNFINALPLKTIYNEDYSTYAYVNYMDRQGNGYLVPQALGDGQDTIEDMLDVLQTTYQPVGDTGLLTATLPNTVKIVDQGLNGSELAIVFTDELYTFAGDDIALKNLMMNSIVQSFTSLPMVDTVVITTESHKDGMIGSVPLGTPLSANRFLNPIK
jgi:hypothetical protein